VFTAVGVGFFAAMLLTQAMTARLGKQILALGAVVTAVGSVFMARFRAEHGTAGRTHRPHRRAGSAAALGLLARCRVKAG
jgi:hypothetical protein